MNNNTELVLVKAWKGNVLHNNILFKPGDKQTFIIPKTDEMIENGTVKVLGNPKESDLKKAEIEKSNLKSVIQLKDEELKKKDYELEALKSRILALEKASVKEEIKEQEIVIPVVKNKIPEKVRSKK